jgi:hypothetical protein
LDVGVDLWKTILDNLVPDVNLARLKYVKFKFTDLSYLTILQDFFRRWISFRAYLNTTDLFTKKKVPEANKK